MCAWEISPTLEERPVLSSRMGVKLEREKGCREGEREGRKGKLRRASKEWVREKEARYRPPAPSRSCCSASVLLFLVAESSQNSFDYKSLIEKHGFS